MSKYFLKTAALGILFAAFLWAGAALQNHHEKAVAPATPIALIAVQSCGEIKALIVITADGLQHFKDGGTLDEAKALATAHPEMSGGLLNAPCAQPKESSIS
jgi:hypothetical protein